MSSLATTTHKPAPNSTSQNGTEEDQKATFELGGLSPSSTPVQKTRRISLGQPMRPPGHGEIVSLQKEIKLPQINAVHPVISSIKEAEIGGTNRDKTVTLPPLSPNMPMSPSFNNPVFLTPQMPPKVAKTMSYDSRLNEAKDEDKPTTIPSPGRRRRFGSVDLVLSKVKKALKKPSSSEPGDEKPKSVKVCL
jgi:hypothetical protein